MFTLAQRDESAIRKDRSGDWNSDRSEADLAAADSVRTSGRIAPGYPEIPFELWLSFAPDSAFLLPMLTSYFRRSSLKSPQTRIGQSRPTTPSGLPSRLHRHDHSSCGNSGTTDRRPRASSARRLRFLRVPTPPVRHGPLPERLLQHLCGFAEAQEPPAEWTEGDLR